MLPAGTVYRIADQITPIQFECNANHLKIQCQSNHRKNNQFTSNPEGILNPYPLSRIQVLFMVNLSINLQEIQWV